MKKYAHALAAALLAGAAHADQPAYAYVGIAGGASHISVDCTGATSCDKTDTGGKFTAGYNFGNGFGLEGAYVSFGKAQGSDGLSSATLKPTAFMLGGVFSLPLSNEWGVNLRLGAAQVKTKVDARQGSLTGSRSETKTKAYAGVGLTYAVSPSVKLELAVDSTQGQFADEKGTIRLITAGATFAF
jgi:opacity protein-like surface antigen